MKNRNYLKEFSKVGGFDRVHYSYDNQQELSNYIKKTNGNFTIRVVEVTKSNQKYFLPLLPAFPKDMCSICGKKLIDPEVFANNPFPYDIRKGARCCDECNKAVDFLRDGLTNETIELDYWMMDYSKINKPKNLN